MPRLFLFLSLNLALKVVVCGRVFVWYTKWFTLSNSGTRADLLRSVNIVSTHRVVVFRARLFALSGCYLLILCLIKLIDWIRTNFTFFSITLNVFSKKKMQLTPLLQLLKWTIRVYNFYHPPSSTKKNTNFSFEEKVKLNNLIKNVERCLSAIISRQTHTVRAYPSN